MRGITLRDLRKIPEPNELARRAIVELEAEHARGCQCDVELVNVHELGATRGSIVTFKHALGCPRWQAVTS